MNKTYAFTLIELLIVLLIITVISSIAIPSLHHLLQKNQLAVITQKWLHTFQFAKNIALSQHQVVSLCASADDKTCSGSWQNGMLVFINNNEILRSYRAAPENIVISWNRKRNLIQFSASGMLKSQNGTLFICSKTDPSLAKAVVLSKTGRARIDTVSGNKNLPALCKK